MATRIDRTIRTVEPGPAKPLAVELTGLTAHRRLEVHRVAFFEIEKTARKSFIGERREGYIRLH